SAGMAAAGIRWSPLLSLPLRCGVQAWTIKTQARLWPTRCKSSRAIAKSAFCNHMRPYDHGSDSFAIAGARKFNRRRQCLLAAARAADSIGADDDGGGRRRRAGTSERNRDVRDRRRRIARRRSPLVLGGTPLRLSGAAVSVPRLVIARHLCAGDRGHLRALGL